MPHTPRTADGAEQGGARPAAPRQPSSPISTRIATSTPVCIAANLLAPAHASPQVAARAVSLTCSFVKVSRHLARVSDFVAMRARKPPWTPGLGTGSAASPREAVILRPRASPRGSARHCPRRPARQCLGSVEHCPSTNQEPAAPESRPREREALISPCFGRDRHEAVLSPSQNG